MEEQNNWASGFEFVDIEIIDHHRQPEVLNPQKWSCDHCNLFYLSYENLMEHKKKHMNNSQVKCRYCNKVLSVTEESRECYANGKCETCEYRCSQCPKRFLRHSSLMNHENNHSQPKKNKRPHPRSANIEVPKLESTQKTVNKKILKTVDSEALCSNSAPVETDIPTKGKRKPSSSPKKRTRLQSQKPMIESNINDGDIDINNSRVSKRSSLILLKDNHNLKSSKQTKEKFIKTSDTAITKNQVGVSTPTAQTGTSSSEVNSVNYKPFSCHVCNDNFASENILLEHIKSHGDAAKHFKCRFCPEAFDTIYDIQYHLAVCPLAEDELESTLMNSTPPKLVITSPRSLNKPLTKGKRGRPKKFRDSLPNSKEEMVTSDIAKSDSAPLVRTRNKRKSLEKPVEPSNKILKVSSSSVPDTTVKNRSVEREVKFDDPQSNLSETDVTGDDYQSPNNDSFVTSVKNQEKHHSCPFPRCDRKFTREKALECHMRNHNDDLDETLQCYKCDIPFDDVKSLRMHVDECQGLREEKDDDFSGPKQNKNERQDANKTGPHKFGDDFLCKTCGRTYQSKEKLKSHNCTGSNPLSMKFPCRLCSMELTDQQMLRNHFTLYHPENLQFQCRTCHTEFDNLSEIISHMGSHLKTSNSCSFCFKTFPTKKDLQTHYTTKHPGVDRRICLICNKKYSDPGALAKHTMVHTGERPYYCPFCYMTFSLKCSQVVHIRRHTNYRPYKCQYCPKRFFNAGEIRKHIRLHTGEKPYKCTICKTAYTMRETLTNHLKTHKKCKLKCPRCPLVFNDQLMLETHLTTHSGVKPFMCPLCSETSLYLGSLKKHIVSEHIDSLNTNCQICGQFEDGIYSLAQHILTHRTDYVRSKTQWFDYVKKATKFPSSSKNKIVIQRKTTPKEINKRPRNYLDIVNDIFKDESHQPGMVEDAKSECLSNANGKETISGNQSNQVQKTKVEGQNTKINKRPNNKKHNKKDLNHEFDNSVLSEREEYEEKFDILPTNIDTLSCEDSDSSCTIKTEIKEEYKEIKEEEEEEEEEETEEEEEEIEVDDDDDDKKEGIKEVEVPGFEFLQRKKEFECSICPEYFTCQEDLLNHVAVHI